MLGSINGFVPIFIPIAYPVVISHKFFFIKLAKICIFIGLFQELALVLFDLLGFVVYFINF